MSVAGTSFSAFNVFSDPLWILAHDPPLTQYLHYINCPQLYCITLQRVCGRLLHTPKVTVWLTHQGGGEYFYRGGLHHWGRSVGKRWRMCLAEGKNRGVTVNRDITGPESGEWEVVSQSFLWGTRAALMTEEDLYVCVCFCERSRQLYTVWSLPLACNCLT